MALRPWHNEETIFGARCVCQNLILDIAICDDIFTHGQRRLNHGGHRIHAVNIDLVQLVDPAEDAIQFPNQFPDMLFADGNARQAGNLADIILGDRHERTPTRENEPPEYAIGNTASRRYVGYSCP